MYTLLLRLIIISAFIQLGLSLSDFIDCRSGECRSRLDRAAKEVLHINWRSISVFPEEAKRFK